MIGGSDIQQAKEGYGVLRKALLGIGGGGTAENRSCTSSEFILSVGADFSGRLQIPT